MRGRKKHVVSSFSYPVDKVDMVMEAEQKAAKDGKSLSQVITDLLEQYTESKKVEGQTIPIVAYNINEVQQSMHQSTILQFANSSTNYIEQELTGMHDRKLLVLLEAKGHTLKYSAKKRLHDLDFMARIGR
jgi:hypothetical protein